MDLNPVDGIVYAAIHSGVFRLESDGPVRVADRYQDTMGFTIAGPDLFLASGHPPPGGRSAPPGVRDQHRPRPDLDHRGPRWEGGLPRALRSRCATVYGYDSTSGRILRSDDGGRSRSRQAEVAAADLDVDPADDRRVLVTTEQGLLESPGRSATPRGCSS